MPEKSLVSAGVWRAGVTVIVMDGRPMFAVVRTGGKQYRVAAGDKIAVEKIDGEAGDTVALTDILLAGDGGEMAAVAGLTVSAEIIAQTRGEKVIVFKKRRRHNYRRRNGHRQSLTLLRITAIGAAAKAAPKKAAKAEAEAPAAEVAAAAPAKKPAAKKAAPKKDA
jgi:large subunit ribosomal protein L21